MAQFRIIPKDDWDILKKYLEFPIEVLIPEHIFNELDETDQKKLIDYIENGCGDEYNCGGDADHWVDIAHSTSHLALQTILGKDDTD